MTATCAIIPASGLGERLSRPSGKTFTTLDGQPLIAHTLTVFQECRQIDEIVLIVRSSDIPAAKSLVQERAFTKVHAVIAGGPARQDSVRNGLAAISPQCNIVAIHDGARPLVTHDIIRASIASARENGAAIAAVPVIDTIKASTDGFVGTTIDRSELYAVQTPQTFRVSTIKSAYEQAYEDGFLGTDDAFLVERLGLPVAVVAGSYENLKITTPPDIILAEAIMRHRHESQNGPTAMPRIGHGYDIHQFAPGRRLYLGGIEFPGEEGLLGHSDADVMLHAIADAILGAAALDDIGHLFPNTDPAYKDASSLILLAKVGEVVRERGWRIGNIDVTLIGERPRIAGHTSAMKEKIATALSISPDQLSIKATTAEGLGAIGQGLGIECHAVALLYS